MQKVLDILSINPILNCAIAGWFIAQALKVVLELIFRHRLDLGRFFSSGGMPSSHTACVMVLTVATGRTCGLSSPLFAMALVFSCIVMYDATGVRRAAGEQARVLNLLLLEREKAGAQKALKEFLGHTPLEFSILHRAIRIVVSPDFPGLKNPA